MAEVRGSTGWSEGAGHPDGLQHSRTWIAIDGRELSVLLCAHPELLGRRLCAYGTFAPRIVQRRF